MLKNVMEIGTVSKIPIIPETRDNIITVNDVRVLILRIGIPEAYPGQLSQQPRLSQQLLQQHSPQQLSGVSLQQSAGSQQLNLKTQSKIN